MVGYFVPTISPRKMDRDLLERIAIALEAIATRPTHRLGLHEGPTAKYLYVGRDGEERECWYFFRNQQRIPIAENCLTGKLVSVSTTTKEFRGKENPKLLVEIDAGTKYIIQAGIDTMFALSLLQALDRASAEQFRHPISIGVYPGSEEKIVWAKVWVDGQVVKADWDKDANAALLINRINHKINPPPTITPTTDLTDINMLIREQVDIRGWDANNYQKIREFIAHHFAPKTALNQLHDGELVKLLELLRNVK